MKYQKTLKNGKWKSRIKYNYNKSYRRNKTQYLEKILILNLIVTIIQIIILIKKEIW